MRNRLKDCDSYMSIILTIKNLRPITTKNITLFDAHANNMKELNRIQWKPLIK